MQIEVRTRGFPLSSALRNYAERGIIFALDRFEDSINHVRIRLEDVNGTRGGVDKRCHITIEGPEIGTQNVDALELDLYAAIDAAAARAARKLSRVLDRQHTLVSLRRAVAFRLVS